MEKENLAEEKKEVIEEVIEEVEELTETEPKDDEGEEKALAEVQAEVADEVPAEAQAEETVNEVAEEVTEEAAEESAEVEAGALKPAKKKKWWIPFSIVLTFAFLICGAYLYVSDYYNDRFFMKTSVNGIDCSEMTVEEVEDILQSQVEQYVLTVTGRNGLKEVINGTDIGIQYNGVSVIQEAFAEQNPYLWVKGFFAGNEIDAAIDFTYDQEKLDEVITNLECLKAENQVAPTSAKPVYADNVYTIQAEDNGAQINTEQFKEAINASVAAFEVTLDLESVDCYEKPVYTKDSAEVIAAKDALNKCLQTNVTYSLDGITVNVNAETVAPWISVDDKMNLVIDAAKVRAFTDTLGSKYNTPDTTDQITTPTGKTTVVYGGRLGRIVGSAAECNKLIDEIKAGAQTVREPILTQKGTPDGATSWGTTYIEVDITEQHMWYIVDGVVAFESDVVTGSPGRDTPTGKFQILEKLQNKVLRGNIMPNGKPEYVTPVKYWARITWSGVGFHDATWQAEFGGERYKEGYGSHGCINMPLSAIKQLYGMISQGTAVVIHY